MLLFQATGEWAESISFVFQMDVGFAEALVRLVLSYKCFEGRISTFLIAGVGI